MTLEITLPFGRKDNLKNLVFSILIHESPLKIIELTNFIRKRYGKSVTFQAVRKAIMQLVDDEVLTKEETEFSISKEWIKNTKEVIDNLYEEINREESKPRKMDSIEGDVSVFSFNSLNDVMKFWQNIIDDWYRKFKKGDYDVNCFQGAHSWEGILHPDREAKLMGQLRNKGIKSYAICTSNTVLDRSIAKFYNKIGLKYVINQSSSRFDRSYYVATYGDFVIQVQYPDELVELMDDYFRKNKSLEDLDLNELSKIVNKKIKMRLTIIKNLSMAKQMNESILSQID